MPEPRSPPSKPASRISQGAASAVKSTTSAAKSCPLSASDLHTIQCTPSRLIPPSRPLNSVRHIYDRPSNLAAPSPFTQVTSAINNRLRTPVKSSEQMSYTFYKVSDVTTTKSPLAQSTISNHSNMLQLPRPRPVVNVRGVEYDLAPVMYLGPKDSFDNINGKTRSRLSQPSPIITKVASRPIYASDLRPTNPNIPAFPDQQQQQQVYQSLPPVYETFAARPTSIVPAFPARGGRTFQTPVPALPYLPACESAAPPATPPPPPPSAPALVLPQCPPAKTQPTPCRIPVPVPVPIPVAVPVAVNVPLPVPVPVAVKVPVHCCSNPTPCSGIGATSVAVGGGGCCPPPPEVRVCMPSKNECSPNLGKTRLPKQKKKRTKMIAAYLGPPIVIPGYTAYLEQMNKNRQQCGGSIENVAQSTPCS